MSKPVQTSAFRRLVIENATRSIRDLNDIVQSPRTPEEFVALFRRGLTVQELAKITGMSSADVFPNLKQETISQFKEMTREHTVRRADARKAVYRDLFAGHLVPPTPGVAARYPRLVKAFGSPENASAHFRAARELQAVA